MHVHPGGGDDLKAYQVAWIRRNAPESVSRRMKTWRGRGSACVPEPKDRLTHWPLEPGGHLQGLGDEGQKSSSRPRLGKVRRLSCIVSPTLWLQARQRRQANPWWRRPDRGSQTGGMTSCWRIAVHGQNAIIPGGLSDAILELTHAGCY